MKKLLFSLCLTALTFGLKAQTGRSAHQFNFNAGKTFSSFLFADTSGKEDENLRYRVGNTYNMSVGFALGKRHLLRPEIHYSEMGATSTVLDAPVEWKLNYVGVGTGYLCRLNKSDSLFSLSLGALMSYDYLLKGEQMMGDTRYNLQENDALKDWNLNAGVLLNSRFKVTETLYLNFEYRFNMGLNQIEKKDQGEQTKNIGHKALLGLSFNL